MGENGLTPEFLPNRVDHVLGGQTLSPPPIWLMRQAGRYLPEYRALRTRAGSFLDLCLNPDLAASVTLQPIERFDLDAAILFSDILIVPYGLGRRLDFVEGEGPRLDPIDGDGIAQLDLGGFAKRTAPVLETVSEVRRRLDGGKALIGFCGGAWTVATYMVAGHGTVDQAPARLLAKCDPDLFQVLIDRIVDASVAYLIGQVQAGAGILQIFDSWAGVLDDEGFTRWCIAPTRRIIEAVRAAVPHVKVIGFPKGAGLRLAAYVRQTGVDGVSIDWTVPGAFARDHLQPLAAVQGNLDPLTLVAGAGALDAAVDGILETLSGGRFIFNLGHGIVPETPIRNVEQLVARVRAHG